MSQKLLFNIYHLSIFSSKRLEATYIIKAERLDCNFYFIQAAKEVGVENNFHKFFVSDFEVCSVVKLSIKKLLDSIWGNLVGLVLNIFSLNFLPLVISHLLFVYSFS